MKEQFCSYEISLILKELGFDDDCLMCFTSRIADINFSELWYSDQIWDNSDFHPNSRICKNSDFGNDKSCTAPLWQQAIDWFREEYGIDIHPRRVYERPILNESQPIKWKSQIDKTDSVGIAYNDSLDEVFNTYKEAREQAILKAIELIKTNKC